MTENETQNFKPDPPRNHPIIEEAIKNVFERLLAMSDEELKKSVEDYRKRRDEKIRRVTSNLMLDNDLAL